MGAYQSRSAHTLQDIWRDEWSRSYTDADKKLLSDVKSLTTISTAWHEFHQACARSDVPFVTNFLANVPANERKTEVDRKTVNNWTPLHICAVGKDNNEVIAILIANGADPTILTRNGFSALHLAACVGNTKNLKDLLAAPNVKTDVKGFHHMSPLHVAAAFGNEKIVKLLLESGFAPNVVDKNRFSPLHIASHLGHTRVVEELMAYGAQIDLESQNSDTPLHLACYQDHRALATLLVERYKAYVSSVDKDLFTPLHYCCRRGYLSMVLFLLGNGADPAAKNVYEDTPLHCACYNGWVGVCQALIEYGGVDVIAENIYSETPLHAACTFGATTTLIDFLLAQDGVDINHQGKDGHTPLHSACLNGHFHVVKALIERGADCRILDCDESPPIKWAYQKGFDEIVEYLRSCYDDESEVQEFETPSPIGKIRLVTKEKVEMLQLRGVLSELKGQIPLSEVDFYEVIGQGSFGSVYKGKYKNQTVAVKKLKPGIFRARYELEKFCREVQILCELNHPNVIGFIGACTREPSQLCIMTEYARGGSLHSVIHQQKRRLDLQKKLDIATDVAKGMQYLHNLPHPIIHRDLNPRNILLNDKGTALVADFGESRLILKKSSGVEEMTKQSGNLRYMAPEVFMQSEYNEKADIFNYGLCTWELFAEQIPFEDLPAAAAAAEMAYNGSRPPFPDNWSEDLRLLISGCWQAQPEKRPSFDNIVNDLKNKRPLIQIFRTTPEEIVIVPNPNEEIVIVPTKKRAKGDLRVRSNSVTTAESDYVKVIRGRSRKPFQWSEEEPEILDEIAKEIQKDKKLLWKGTL